MCSCSLYSVCTCYVSTVLPSMPVNISHNVELKTTQVDGAICSSRFGTTCEIRNCRGSQAHIRVKYKISNRDPEIVGWWWLNKAHKMVRWSLCAKHVKVQVYRPEFSGAQADIYLGELKRRKDCSDSYQFSLQNCIISTKTCAVMIFGKTTLTLIC